MFQQPLDASSSTIFSVGATIAVCIGLAALFQLFASWQLKKMIHHLLEVTDRSHHFFPYGNAPSAYDIYPGFRYCSETLERGLTHIREGNEDHARELLNEARQHLASIPAHVVSRIEWAVDHHPQVPAAGSAPFQIVRLPAAPSAQTSPAGDSQQWDVQALLKRISDLLDRHNSTLVMQLVAPDVVDLLIEGGETSAYERMSELKAVLDIFDLEFSQLFIAAVSTKFLEALRKQNCPVTA